MSVLNPRRLRTLEEIEASKTEYSMGDKVLAPLPTEKDGFMYPVLSKGGLGLNYTT
jgi:hypothetical protein